MERLPHNLQHILAARFLQPLHDLADLLRAAAIRNQQRIRRIDHNQILHTQQRHQLLSAST